MRNLSFSHFSARPLENEIYSEQQDKEPSSKPNGFWVSVDGEDDWPSWCEAESFGLNRLETRSIVTLNTENILFLSGHLDLKVFQQGYGVSNSYLSSINWFAVSADYQGIIIAPYQWSCRMEMSWYYGWDCASGCIWDADAIESVTVKHEEVA